jgi:hypothetical protein
MITFKLINNYFMLELEHIPTYVVTSTKGKAFCSEHLWHMCTISYFIDGDRSSSLVDSLFSLSTRCTSLQRKLLSKQKGHVASCWRAACLTYPLHTSRRRIRYPRKDLALAMSYVIEHEMGKNTVKLLRWLNCIFSYPNWLGFTLQSKYRHVPFAEMNNTKTRAHIPENEYGSTSSKSRPYRAYLNRGMRPLESGIRPWANQNRPREEGTRKSSGLAEGWQTSGKPSIACIEGQHRVPVSSPLTHPSTTSRQPTRPSSSHSFRSFCRDQHTLF